MASKYEPEINRSYRELAKHYGTVVIPARVRKPALLPLPSRRFEIALWKKAKANIDYHVELEGSYYSIPYKNRGVELVIRYTESTVEIFHSHRRIAVHNKLYKKGHTSTIKEHMPSWHREYSDWSPSRILNLAQTMGGSIQEVCKKIIESREHPEQSYRACKGIFVKRRIPILLELCQTFLGEEVFRPLDNQSNAV